MKDQGNVHPLLILAKLSIIIVQLLVKKDYRIAYFMSLKDGTSMIHTSCGRGRQLLAIFQKDFKKRNDQNNSITLWFRLLKRLHTPKNRFGQCKKMNNYKKG